ncbi:MAG: hypothetical protein QOI74_630 [Micromonosporaceae bacterium]|nr:hypothetical protein [Micromonosporaceae bacterium]
MHRDPVPFARPAATATGFDDIMTPPELPPPRSRRTDDSGNVRRRQSEQRLLPDGQLPDRRRLDRRQEEGSRRAGTASGASGRSTGPVAATGPSRPWLTALTAAGIAIVFTALGLGGYVVINRGNTGAGPARPGRHADAVQARDISNRVADPAPLTEREVFPDPQVTAGTDSYRLLKTQAADCAGAATDEIAALLTKLGCSQVVRGTLASADGRFLVTAGIFNLADEAGANQAYDSVKPVLDSQKGRLTGFAAGDGTEAIVRAPTTLGWHPRGHFLAYCIVARADSQPIAADDASAKQVIADLVEKHLRDAVIAARAVASSTAGPSPTA